MLMTRCFFLFIYVSMDLKPIIFSLLIAQFCLINLSGQLSVSFESYRFKTPEHKSYLELHLRIAGDKLLPKFSNTQDGSFTLGAEVVIVLQRDSQIVDYRKFVTQTGLLVNPVDIIHKDYFNVVDGHYQLMLKVNDVQNSSSVFERTYPIEIAGTEAFLSDIILANEIARDSSFQDSRSGYIINALPYRLISREDSSLYVYLEVYNSDINDGKLYLKTSIFNMESLRENQVPQAVLTKKLKSIPVEAVILNFDLRKIPSGAYIVKSQLLNAQRNVIYEREAEFFNVNVEGDLSYYDNPDHILRESFVQELDSAEVRYALMALVPVVPNEILPAMKKIIHKSNTTAQRLFLHRYWLEVAPDHSKESYDAYMRVAKMVDKQFYNTAGFGFQNDMGYIYLKYGRPSKMISVEDEPNTPPYQIWYYDYMPKTNQTNVKFLFYNPSLAYNNFELLHSTCLYERRDPAWELKLYKNSPNEIKGGRDIDATQMNDNWMRRARKLFDDF